MFLTDERYLEWAEAFVRCQSLNGSLAKIDDCWLQKEIANYIENVIGENGEQQFKYWYCLRAYGSRVDKVSYIQV